MSELTDLYQELILDHNRSPRNRGRLENPDGLAQGYNPLCGDQISVSVKLDGDRIESIKFEGSGCAISTASASLMTQSLKGKTLEEAGELFNRFHKLLTEEGNAEELGQGMGKLKVFSGVCQYPARVKCATLAWHTVKAALNNKEGNITTE
ncbi:MAG: SUF system NifU family Fe-S cluster assembly protein [Planctomycetes bacterium]|nr:SUF system NifU family Fe-S cluster assembly protein [Planctomycetota bacterium]